MAENLEIKKINVKGVDYNLKDEVARDLATYKVLPVDGTSDISYGSNEGTNYYIIRDRVHSPGDEGKLVLLRRQNMAGGFYVDGFYIEQFVHNNETSIPVYYSNWESNTYPSPAVYEHSIANNYTLYYMNGTLYRKVGVEFVQVAGGNATGSVGEGVSIMYDPSDEDLSYVFGNGARIGADVVIGTGHTDFYEFGNGAYVGKNSKVSQYAEIGPSVQMEYLSKDKGGTREFMLYEYNNTTGARVGRLKIGGADTDNDVCYVAIGTTLPTGVGAKPNKSVILGKGVNIGNTVKISGENHIDSKISILNDNDKTTACVKIGDGALSCCDKVGNNLVTIENHDYATAGDTSNLFLSLGSSVINISNTAASEEGTLFSISWSPDSIVFTNGLGKSVTIPLNNQILGEGEAEVSEETLNL
jgi:acetyltransferase-like isoleucine patch superfamily enzyme